MASRLPPPRQKVQGRSAPNAPSVGRPRSEEASRAILDATLSLLARHGFSKLRVEQIAEIAGVSTATIYRRWPSKIHLAAAAFGELPGLPAPDHGNLEEDLVELVMSILDPARKAPLSDILPALAAERAQNPDFAALVAPAIRDKRKPFFAALHRGIDRGELPSTLNLDVAVDLFVGPVLTRIVMTGDVVDERYVRLTVRTTIAGLVAVPESS